MSLIDNIKQPIAAEMQAFKRVFASALKSDNPLISSVNDYILEGSGKQLRPILTLLSAKLCGSVTDATYNGALALELLHNASLIHDDVVDFTMERRGRHSINARWSNKIAVLSGDYMLSNALISATKTNNLQILKAVANIGMELSDGELIQLLNTNKTKITEKDYYNIIRKKTALLFATCTEVGALSANADAESITHLKKFGENLGLCFQIKDDIFDYYQDIEIGKPTGNDLQDGKVTLPLIFALQKAEITEKGRIISMIESKNFSDENIKLILEFAQNMGGLKYAEDCMTNFKNEAIKELQSFADCAEKEALIKCAEFASQRNN